MSRVEILQELNYLGVDSIELMEFIINLEDEFSLEISDNTIDHMDKVSDLLDYLSEQLNNK